MILFIGRVEGGNKKGVTNWMELTSLVLRKMSLRKSAPFSKMQRKREKK